MGVMLDCYIAFQRRVGTVCCLSRKLPTQEQPRPNDHGCSTIMLSLSVGVYVGLCLCTLVLPHLCFNGFP